MEGDCDGGAVSLIQNDDDGEESGCQNDRKANEGGVAEGSGQARVSESEFLGLANRPEKRVESCCASGSAACDEGSGTSDEGCGTCAAAGPR